MTATDLTDAEWELVGPLLATGRGRPGHENRRHLDGILWRAREGARWRAIPERYGKWNTVWRRFARWRDLGLFEAVLAALAGRGAAEERVQMIDATVIRAHQHAAGAKGDRTARRPAARDRPHARPDARGPHLRCAGRVHGPGHALPDRRHGLRRRPDQAGPAAPRRAAGDPVQPGPQAAAPARSRAVPAEEPGRAVEQRAQAVPRGRDALR